jgi:hypothetical protein
MNYACIPSRATISGGDGMDPSTRVYDAKHAWAPTTMFLHTRHLRSPLPEDPGQAMLIRYWKPLGAFNRRPRPCPGLREAG